MRVITYSSLKRFIFIVLFLCSGVPLYSQNYVTDGNFEDDTPFTNPTHISQQFRTYSLTMQMNFWTITNSVIDKHHRLNWNMGSPPGGIDHHIDLNPDGKIEQLITGLTIGNTYKLSFYTSVHHLFATGCGISSGNIRAAVGFGTMVSDTFTLTAVHQPWTLREYTFTASATTANLVFQGLSSCYGNGGMLVDNVVLSPVCSLSVTATPESRTLCAGDTMVLSAAGGVFYAWSPATGLNNPNIANPVLTATTSQKYIVEASDNNGCIGRDTVEVIVRPSPVITATPGSVQVCPGDTVLLSASGGISYKWSPSAGLNNPDVAGPILTATVSGKYIVTGTNSDGCKGKDSVDVVVVPPPIIRASPDSIRLCEGATVVLSASGNGVSYKWSPALGLDDPEISNPTLTAVATQKYIVTADNGIGCLSFDSLEVFVLPAPIVRAGPEDTIICNNAQIRGYATGAETYKWSPATGIDNDASDTPLIMISDYGILQYVVTGTDAQGCTGTDTVQISVYPPADIQIDQRIIGEGCENTQIQLYASGAQRYQWFPGEYCNNDTIPDPIIDIRQKTTFILNAWDEKGCLTTDSVLVDISGETAVLIPNAFSPNDDGYNDLFKPMIFCDFTLKEFSVFNRWGERVYTTQIAGTGWDGMYKGAPCSMGVYVYYVKGEDNSGAQLLYKGNVTLLR